MGSGYQSHALADLPREKSPVRTVQLAVQAPGPVQKSVGTRKFFASTEVQTPNLASRSELPYRRRCPGPLSKLNKCFIINNNRTVGDRNFSTLDLLVIEKVLLIYRKCKGSKSKYQVVNHTKESQNQAESRHDNNKVIKCVQRQLNFLQIFLTAECIKIYDSFN